MKLPKMSAAEFTTLLEALHACEEARTWAKDKTLAVVVRTCNRGDWLLWLLGKQSDKEGWVTRKQLVLMACAVAEPALKYVKEGEDRPRKAIETARAWVEGKATMQEVKAAAAAAYAAAAYAAAAAYDAASAAAAYAAAGARSKSLKQSADIVRRMLEGF